MAIYNPIVFKLVQAMNQIFKAFGFRVEPGFNSKKIKR